VTDSEPTPDDYASVLAASEAMERAGWRPATLNSQVDAWAELVSSVEVGYGMTIDDYTNDLAVREWLEQVRALVTVRIADSMAARLAPLDQRFREATVAPLRRMPGAGDGWWYRLPRVLVDELRDDAVRMGLVG
jgi:hypothetical protein